MPPAASIPTSREAPARGGGSGEARGSDRGHVPQGSEEASSRFGLVGDYERRRRREAASPDRGRRARRVLRRQQRLAPRSRGVAAGARAANRTAGRGRRAAARRRAGRHGPRPRRVADAGGRPHRGRGPGRGRRRHGGARRDRRDRLRPPSIQCRVRIGGAREHDVRRFGRVRLLERRHAPRARRGLRRGRSRERSGRRRRGVRGAVRDRARAGGVDPRRLLDVEGRPIAGTARRPRTCPVPTRRRERRSAATGADERVRARRARAGVLLRWW